MVTRIHLRRCPPAHSTFGRDNLGEILGPKLPFRQAQIHSKPADAGYSNILHCLVAKTHLRRCPLVHSTFGRDNLGRIIGLKLPFWQAQIHSKPADAGYSNILHCLVAKTHLRRCPPVHSTFGRDNLSTIIGLKLPFRRAQIHRKPADAGYSNLLHCMVAKTHLHRCPPVHSTFGRDNFWRNHRPKITFPASLNTQPEQTG
jgi:hypothetical protein